MPSMLHSTSPLSLYLWVQEEKAPFPPPPIAAMSSWTRGGDAPEPLLPHSSWWQWVSSQSLPSPPRSSLTHLPMLPSPAELRYLETFPFNPSWSRVGTDRKAAAVDESSQPAPRSISREGETEGEGWEGEVLLSKEGKRGGAHKRRGGDCYLIWRQSPQMMLPWCVLSTLVVGKRGGWEQGVREACTTATLVAVPASFFSTSKLCLCI